MKSIINYLSIILLSLWLISCEDQPIDTPASNGELSVLFSLPAFDVPLENGTRLDEDENGEYKVGVIDVFVFAKSDDVCIAHHSTERFYNVDKHGGVVAGKYKREIRIPNMPDEKEYYILLITNAEKAIAEAGSDWTGYTYTEIGDVLEMKFEKPAQGVSWKGIPMWGKSASFQQKKADLETNVRFPSVEVDLHRALVRTDIIVDDAVKTVWGDFKIKAVHAYNTNSAIALVPNKDAFADVINPGVPTAPTIPASATVDAGPLEFTISPSSKVQHEVYFPESAAGSLSTIAEHTFLVIEATHNQSSGASRYYRIDYIKKKDSNTSDDFFPLVRNHKYVFTIKQVLSSGFESLDIAKQTIGNNNNIVVDLVCEDDNYSNIYYDGYNYMKLERKCIYRDYEKQTVTFEVETNGEATVKAEDPLWLTVSVENGGTTNTDGLLKAGVNKVTVEFEENKGAGAPPRRQDLIITPKGGNKGAKIAVLQFNQKFIEFKENMLNKRHWATRKQFGTAIPLGLDGEYMAKDTDDSCVEWVVTLHKDEGDAIERIITTSNNPDYIAEADRDLLYYQHESTDGLWGFNGTVEYDPYGKPKKITREDTGNDMLFRFQMENRWEEPNYEKEVTFQFQAVDDPTCIMDYTITVFGQMKLGNLLVTPVGMHYAIDIVDENGYVQEYGKNQSYGDSEFEKKLKAQHENAYYPRWGSAGGHRDRNDTYITEYTKGSLYRTTTDLLVKEGNIFPSVNYSDFVYSQNLVGDKFDTWQPPSFTTELSVYWLMFNAYRYYGLNGSGSYENDVEDWRKNAMENGVFKDYFWEAYAYHMGISPVMLIETKYGASGGRTYLVNYRKRCDLKGPGALNYGMSTKVMGRDSWRLPTSAELESIYDGISDAEQKSNLANLSLQYHLTTYSRKIKYHAGSEIDCTITGQLYPSVEPRISWDVTGGSSGVELKFWTSSNEIDEFDNHYVRTFHYKVANGGFTGGGVTGKGTTEITNFSFGGAYAYINTHSFCYPYYAYFCVAPE